MSSECDSDDESDDSASGPEEIEPGDDNDDDAVNMRGPPSKSTNKHSSKVTTSPYPLYDQGGVLKRKEFIFLNKTFLYVSCVQNT